MHGLKWRFSQGFLVSHSLAVEYRSTRVGPKLADRANARQWGALLSLMQESPIAAQHALEAACDVCFFDVEQAMQLVQLVRNLGGNRVLAMVPLLSRCVYR